MKKHFFTYTLLLFLIVSNHRSFAQTKSKETLSDFNIAVSFTEKGIQFEAAKGCAWTKLNFDSIKQEGIDNFGMNDTDTPTKKTTFYFTVERTKTGLKLKGLKGTAWKELSFVVKSHKKYQLTASGVKAL